MASAAKIDFESLKATSLGRSEGRCGRTTVMTSKVLAQKVRVCTTDAGRHRQDLRGFDEPSATTLGGVRMARRAKRHCKYGVNKRTHRCLKHKRSRKH